MARILALHGFTGDGSSWDGVRALLPAEWRLETPDLPGHGGADTDLPGSWAACLDRLAPAEPAHLLGYSLGARLALGLLVERPATVLSATLIGVDPGLAGDQRRSRAAGDDRLAADLERDGLEAFVDRWQRLPLFASQVRLDPALLAAQRQRRLRHAPGGLAWTLRVLGTGRMPDYRQRLAGVDRPVRLMAGELDTKFRQLACRLRDARPPGAPALSVEIVPDAGHNLPLETPAAVARAVVATAESCSLQTAQQPA